MVICSARLGTNDLEATIEWWGDLKVPVWGIIPERVSIAAGPAARLSPDGLDFYGKVFKKVSRGSSLTGPAQARLPGPYVAQLHQRGMEATAAPGDRCLAVQLTHQFGEEPPPHRNAGVGDAGNVEQLGGPAELIRLVEHGGVELALRDR